MDPRNGIVERRMTTTSEVVLQNVCKRFGDGVQAVTALADVSLEIRHGEFVSVIGQSGSGKSTLLNLIAGLDAPTSGKVVVDGHDLWSLSEAERSDLRLWHIGIVFQSFNLFPSLTIEENVSWRLEFQGLSTRVARGKAAAILEEVGIGREARRRVPAELSGGEQQRVGIARALATGPRLLLADEPTGNLDSRTGETILTLLRQLNTERSLTVVMVTHDVYAATYGQRTIELRDGRVRRDVDAGTIADIGGTRAR
jgi:ABC-type lipoprotein export system ATPase subunit